MTNQRTSCITYIHNIYLQWYLQQDPKLFSIILLKQTAATVLVKAPSLNPVSGFDPPHQRHLHLFSTNQRLPKFFAIAPSWFTVPVNLQQQCSSNRHKGICSSSSGGGSSEGNSSRSNISIMAESAAAAWQPHGAYQARPWSVHACVIDISDRPGPLQLHTLP